MSIKHLYGREVRLPVGLPIVLEHPGGEVSYLSTTNISRYGVFMPMNMPRRPDELVKLNIDLPHTDINLFATVVHAKGAAKEAGSRPPGMGVRFNELNRSGMYKLWDYYYDCVRGDSLDAQLVGLAQLSEYVGFPERVLRKLMREGEFPFYVDHTIDDVIFLKNDIDHWTTGWLFDPYPE